MKLPFQMAHSMDTRGYKFVIRALHSIGLSNRLGQFIQFEANDDKLYMDMKVGNQSSLNGLIPDTGQSRVNFIEAFREAAGISIFKRVTPKKTADAEPEDSSPRRGHQKMPSKRTVVVDRSEKSRSPLNLNEVRKENHGLHASNSRPKKSETVTPELRNDVPPRPPKSPQVKVELDTQVDLKKLEETLPEIPKFADATSDDAERIFSSNFHSAVIKIMPKDSPVAEDVLRAEFLSTRDQCIQNMPAELRDSSTIKTRIDQHMPMIWEFIRETNSKLWIDFGSKLDEETLRIAESYDAVVEKKLESGGIAADFDQAHAEAEAQVLSEYVQYLKTRDVLSDRQRKERTMNFRKKLDSQIQVTLRRRKAAHENCLLTYQFSIEKAQRKYCALMDRDFEDNKFFTPTEIEQKHRKILQHVIETSELPFDSQVIKRLPADFEVLFRRYQDENELRQNSNIPVLGIDLGTTYCCVGTYRNNAVEIIPNFRIDYSLTTIPSYIAFRKDGTIDVGQTAKDEANKEPDAVVFDAKRLIGRKFFDPRIQAELRTWPFRVTREGNEPFILYEGSQYRPEEISATILAKLKQLAQDFLKVPNIQHAVITVPAYFGHAQRKATKDAAYIAGLNNAVILNEPIAAALAYRSSLTTLLTKHVIVFDLGGGTFDVAVLKLNHGEIRVKAIGGDAHLGGQDFDRNMMHDVARIVKENDGVDLFRGHHSPVASVRESAASRIMQLRSQCERAKLRLSVQDTEETPICIERIDGDYSIDITYQRSDFERINASLFNKAIDIVRSVILDAGLTVEDINDVVLVGGSTRIPKVQALVRDLFDSRTRIRTDINVDEAVARGAAFHAALLYSRGSLERNDRDLRFQDVIPHTLGVGAFLPDVAQEVVRPLIKRNTPITSYPFTRTETNFRTSVDFETSVTVKIYEGESTTAAENTEIGKFKLDGIPPARAGQEKLECTMSINEEGVLRVEARAVSNNVRRELTVEAQNGRMSKKEKKFAKDRDRFRWK